MHALASGRFAGTHTDTQTRLSVGVPGESGETLSAWDLA